MQRTKPPPRAAGQRNLFRRQRKGHAAGTSGDTVQSTACMTVLDKVIACFSRADIGMPFLLAVIVLSMTSMMYIFATARDGRTVSSVSASDSSGNGTAVWMSEAGHSTSARLAAVQPQASLQDAAKEAELRPRTGKQKRSAGRAGKRSGWREGEQYIDEGDDDGSSEEAMMGQALQRGSWRPSRLRPVSEGYVDFDYGENYDTARGKKHAMHKDVREQQEDEEEAGRDARERGRGGGPWREGGGAAFRKKSHRASKYGVRARKHMQRRERELPARRGQDRAQLVDDGGDGGDWYDERGQGTAEDKYVDVYDGVYADDNHLQMGRARRPNRRRGPEADEAVQQPSFHGDLIKQLISKLANDGASSGGAVESAIAAGLRGVESREGGNGESREGGNDDTRDALVLAAVAAATEVAQREAAAASAAAVAAATEAAQRQVAAASATAESTAKKAAAAREELANKAETEAVRPMPLADTDATSRAELQAKVEADAQAHAEVQARADPEVASHAETETASKELRSQADATERERAELAAAAAREAADKEKAELMAAVAAARESAERERAELMAAAEAEAAKREAADKEKAELAAAIAAARESAERERAELMAAAEAEAAKREAADKEMAELTAAVAAARESAERERAELTAAAEAEAAKREAAAAERARKERVQGACVEMGFRTGVRSVAVVDNGPISEEQHRELLSYDVVIRIGTLENYLCWDKIDVWMMPFDSAAQYFTGAGTTLHCNTHKVRPHVLALWLLGGTEHGTTALLSDWPEFGLRPIVPIRHSTWQDMYNREVLHGEEYSKNPSPGWVAIMSSIACLPDGVPLHLYGFNWHPGSGQHAQQEEAFVRELQENGGVTVHEAPCKEATCSGCYIVGPSTTGGTPRCLEDTRSLADRALPGQEPDEEPARRQMSVPAWDATSGEAGVLTGQEQGREDASVQAVETAAEVVHQDGGLGEVQEQSALQPEQGAEQSSSDDEAAGVAGQEGNGNAAVGGREGTLPPPPPPSKTVIDTDSGLDGNGACMGLGNVVKLHNVGVVGNAPITEAQRQELRDMDLVVRIGALDSTLCGDPTTIWLLPYDHAGNRYIGPGSTAHCDTSTVLTSVESLWLIGGPPEAAQHLIEAWPAAAALPMQRLDLLRWQDMYEREVVNNIAVIDPSHAWMAVMSIIQCVPRAVTTHLYGITEESGGLYGQEEMAFYRDMHNSGEVIIHPAPCKQVVECDNCHIVQMVEGGTFECMEPPPAAASDAPLTVAGGLQSTCANLGMYPGMTGGVAVVGNGPIREEQRQELVGYDVVIRMDELSNYACGDPLDVWLLRYDDVMGTYRGLPRSNDDICKDADQALKELAGMLLVGGDSNALTSLLSSHPAIEPLRHVQMSGTTWDAVFQREVQGAGPDAKPSTSWIAVMSAIACLPSDVQLHLYGFSWVPSSSLHAPAEGDFFRKAASSGGITIHSPPCEEAATCGGCHIVASINAHGQYMCAEAEGYVARGLNEG